jgi:hypothetical protein
MLQIPIGQDRAPESGLAKLRVRGREGLSVLRKVKVMARDPSSYELGDW